MSSAFVSDISQRFAVISCFLLHDHSTDWLARSDAVDLPMNFDALAEYILQNDLLYTCADSTGPDGGAAPGVHYVFDPTGWGVQLDTAFTKMMPGCEANSTARGRAAHGAAGDPAPAMFWCDAGVC